MNKIVKIAAITCILVSFSCNKNAENEVVSSESANGTPIANTENVAKTKVEFDKVVHNFGKIEQGDVVETTFVIKNVGENDLYILDAHGSCGCTVPEVENDVVKPGDSTPIKVKFDSKNKKGDLTKTINIRCNTENAIEQVKIKVSIKTK